ncbi:MAG TPA: dodecin [Candidatus Didemnitutus sp.]|nr:dodecin [Candidatus Didemnitutus sp.]
MKNHVYKCVSLVGTSTKSIEDAVVIALKRASRTLRHLRWFEIVETRGEIDKGRVQHWQVTLKVGFTLEE